MTASSTTTATRFIQPKDVAETLNFSGPQTYALVRCGQLPAIKVGGRGQWRIEVSVLEDIHPSVRRDPDSRGRPTSSVRPARAVADCP